MKNLFLLLLVSSAAWSGEPVANPAGFDHLAHYQLDIGAGRLQDAMQKFADATGARIIIGSQDVPGVRTNSVHGRYTPTDALTRMLAGTDLTYAINALGHVVIESRHSMLDRRLLRRR